MTSGGPDAVDRGALDVLEALRSAPADSPAPDTAGKPITDRRVRPRVASFVAWYLSGAAPATPTTGSTGAPDVHAAEKHGVDGRGDPPPGVSAFMATLKGTDWCQPEQGRPVVKPKPRQRTVCESST